MLGARRVFVRKVLRVSFASLRHHLGGSGLPSAQRQRIVFDGGGFQPRARVVRFAGDRIWIDGLERPGKRDRRGLIDLLAKLLNDGLARGPVPNVRLRQCRQSTFHHDEIFLSVRLRGHERERTLRDQRETLVHDVERRARCRRKPTRRILRPRGQDHDRSEEREQQSGDQRTRAFLQGDSDGDGLTNTQESTTTYYQDMSPGGLPKAVPDDGVNVSSNAVSLAQFYGIANAALANFTIDHSRKTDLTAQIGYWNGTAWIDRYVWDPGRRLDSVSVTQPLGNAYVTGTVSVVATVLHPEITSKVEFLVAGQLQGTVNTSVGNDYRWTWNTAGVSEGPTKINATQYDNAGGKAWSEITVNLDQPPAMTWVAPADGALVSGVVNVRVTAADLQGVEWVDFYVDNLYKSRVTTPNDGSSGYLWPWDTSQYCTNGGHTFEAVATENGPLYLTRTMTVTVKTKHGVRGRITSPANRADL